MGSERDRLVLSPQDLEEFRELLVDWSLQGDGPEILEEGGLPDSTDLAAQVMGWARSVLARSTLS